MRHEKSEQLINIALLMQSTSEGIGLLRIQQECGIGRRAAERLRDAIDYLFPSMEEVDTGTKTKAWRLRSSKLTGLAYINADQLADLQHAIDTLKYDNKMAQADSLNNLLIKLKAVNAKISRTETDLTALTEAEGYATRLGPIPDINIEILSELKNAILGNNKITMRYRPRGKDKKEKRTVHPYGFLYGERHYIVAWCEKSKDIRTFSLSNIIDLEIQGDYFEQDENFNLTEHAQRSFGIWQEEPYNVKWKFSPIRAEDVKSYTFHPKQELEELEDGHIIVSFTAGGLLEMSWHLFQWGENVEILEPQELKDKYKSMLEGALNNME